MSYLWGELHGGVEQETGSEHPVPSCVHLQVYLRTNERGNKHEARANESEEDGDDRGERFFDKRVSPDSNLPPMLHDP